MFNTYTMAQEKISNVLEDDSRLFQTGVVNFDDVPNNLPLSYRGIIGSHETGNSKLDLSEELERKIEETVSKAVNFVNGLFEKPTTMSLLSYGSDADFKKYKPEDYREFGSVKVHSEMLDRTRVALSQLGIEVKLTNFIPKKYEKWRKKKNLIDGADARALWGSLQSGAGR